MRPFQIGQEIDRQCVSSVAIPFDETKTVFEAKDAKDLMKDDLQMLSFNETMQELNKPNSILDEIEMKKEGKSFYSLLAKLLDEGKIIW